MHYEPSSVLGCGYQGEDQALSEVLQANGKTDIRGHCDFGVRLSVMPTKS